VTDIARRIAAASVVGVLAVAAVVFAATDSGDDTGVWYAGAASTDRWRELAPSPFARTEVAAARIGKHVYVVGGFEESSGDTTDAVLRYSIKRDRWKQVAPMPVAVNHPTAAARDGRLYVHGGFTAAGALSDPTSALQEYKPDRNRWRRLPDSPTPRAAHALGVIGDRLYAAGGADDTNAQLTELEIYDISEREWTPAPTSTSAETTSERRSKTAASTFSGAGTGAEGTSTSSSATTRAPARGRPSPPWAPPAAASSP
jgi:N-acetylneuraminic acid mutarotase